MYKSVVESTLAVPLGNSVRRCASSEEEFRGYDRANV
jgi:hypothetical protein